ncbi:SHOCT domain-containing protein [Oribacterium sp. P9]|uniref:SHOCT domain-containing protein n=1 Tax=Oribacterium sp. P9 TaxID=3378068 RepID=UPI003966E57D
MSKERMTREKLYQTTMSIARKMLKNSLISKEEYAVIDTKMQEKYQPTLGTLFADIDLL